MKKLLLFCGLILWSCQISPTGIEEGEWHLVREPSGDVHFSAIHFADQQHGWAVGDSGTVIHTGDGGDTWEYQQSGTPNRLRDVYFIDAETGWVVGRNNTLLHTTDGGRSWTLQSIESDTAKIYYDIYFADEQTGWAVHNQGEILYTENGGVTWEVQITLTRGGAFLSFVNGDIGFALLSLSNLLKTEDGGTNWESQPIQLSCKGGISSVFLVPTDICFIDEEHGWIPSGISLASSVWGDSVPIFHTIDGGSTWECQGPLPANDITAIHFVDQYLGWVTGRLWGAEEGSNKIFCTTNGGKTWNCQFDTQEIFIFNDLFFVDGGHGWALAPTGAIYRYVVP